MEQVLGRTVARQRFAAFLLTAFSVLALLLAAIGVYSLLSYLVVEQSKELGVRIALGAQTIEVLRLVAGQGVGWALAGLAAGVSGALVLSRFLRSMLFGVGTADLVTFLGVAALLLLVGIIATLVPAWRASRLDPVGVLRQE
jgi:ABC-type antimicrobial peptide transport system permease subunit